VRQENLAQARELIGFQILHHSHDAVPAGIWAYVTIRKRAVLNDVVPDIQSIHTEDEPSLLRRAGRDDEEFSVFSGSSLLTPNDPTPAEPDQILLNGRKLSGDGLPPEWGPTEPSLSMGQIPPILRGQAFGQTFANNALIHDQCSMSVTTV
jgi:hypothetical protein